MRVRIPKCGTYDHLSTVGGFFFVKLHLVSSLSYRLKCLPYGRGVCEGGCILLRANYWCVSIVCIHAVFSCLLFVFCVFCFFCLCVLLLMLLFYILLFDWWYLLYDIVIGHGAYWNKNLKLYLSILVTEHFIWQLSPLFKYKSRFL